MIAAARQTWPGIVARVISEPFHGIGVAVPINALTYSYPDEAYEAAEELAARIEKELVVWSQNYPETPFVFLKALCVGGNCMYEGYVCKNGAMRFQACDEQANTGDALGQLVDALGVELPATNYFAPLVRGYFDDDAR
jgi:hypothetical protein